MPYALLNAKGLPKIVAMIHILEVFVYGGLIYFLSMSFGVLGAAGAWSIRAMLDFILLSVFVNKYIKNEI